MKANDGKIAVTAYDAKTLESYQIKGTTEYITEGAIVDTFKKQEKTVIHFAFVPIFPILKQRLPLDAMHPEGVSALWEYFEKANRLFIWYLHCLHPLFRQ